MNRTVKRLKEASAGYWVVRESGSNIILNRIFCGKAILIHLIKEDGKFTIKFPSYPFLSGISHYAPSVEELRFCRNKALLTSFIKYLKKAKVWQLIENKDFMVINKENTKSNKQELKKALYELTGK